MTVFDEVEAAAVGDWLNELLASEGLHGGLKELAKWAQHLSPLEREFVRSAAFQVVSDFVDFPVWCPTYGEKRETTRRLVNAALGDSV